MRRYKLLKLSAGLDWNMAEMDKDCSEKKKTPNKKKRKAMTINKYCIHVL